MRKRYYQVKTDTGWKFVEESEFRRPERKGPHIMPDLEEYRPIGGPEAEKFFKSPGEARMIRGRKQHREYLKRNGFQEVGNEINEFTKYGGKTRENYERFRKVDSLPREAWMERVKRG